MTDKTDEPDGDEPITPEVVRPRGAAARKRRRGEAPAGTGDTGPSADGGGDVGGAAAGPATTGTILRVACMLLIAFGVLQVMQFATWVVDAEGARCTLARNRIDFANDDDEDFNDVELPDDVEDVGDLECDQAIALAGTVPVDEDDEPDGDFLSEAFVRNTGIGMLVLAVGQAALGWLTLRTQQRRYRNGAIVLAGVGIVLPFLGLPAAGIITLVIFAFVIFALAFSKDAKATWGPAGLLRPRPPAGEA